MKHKKDYLAIITILCLCITSLCGIFSMNFQHGYDVVNQYGHTVKIFGYGIYAHDSYFKAPISIGTDFCIFFCVVPLFIYAYMKYRKYDTRLSELNLISLYAVSLYYGASIAFGVTYNQIFLIYILLFSTSLFGLFSHIPTIKLNKTVALTKGLTVFLTVSGIALIVAWLPDILTAMLKGETLSLIGVYTTEITYVIDMGLISPLCFVCIFLLKKKNPLGVILLACMLRLCIIVGIMIIPQTVIQMLSGVELPLIALLTKSLSFVALGGFAYYFERKLYANTQHTHTTHVFCKKSEHDLPV